MTETQLVQAYQDAKAHHRAERLDEAEALYRHILRHSPGHADTTHLLGLLLHQQGHHEQGLALITEAVRRKPRAAAFHNNLGTIYKALERLDEAEAAYREALRLKPRYAGALYNLGALRSDQGLDDEALALYHQALALAPDHLDTLIGLGILLQHKKQLPEAEVWFRRAVEHHPTHAQAHLHLGNILQAQGRYQDAVASYRTTVRTRPDLALAYNNLGATLQVLGNLDQAVACFRKALALEPDQPEAVFNLARALDDLGHLDEAVALYEQTLAHEAANATPALCYLYQLRLKLADWHAYEDRRQTLLCRVEEHIQAPDAATLPLLALHYADAPQALHAVAACHQGQQFSRQMAPARDRCAFVHTRHAPDRLRVGYLSPDFRGHPVGLLLHDLFARHDRDAVAVYAYALVPADDDYSHRIREGCDAFVDASLLSPEEAARRIHADGIDLLIDLGGYTAHTRTTILALEPAPVQAHFLGYPNTMGAAFVRYLLADAWLVPEALAPSYTEQIVYLPHAFVGSPLEIDAAPVTRAAFGLPEDAVVFCCFNALYKIEPTVFDVWMRVLQRVPGSVLWLSAGPPAAERALRDEAARRGVAPERLCFAERLPWPQYLARYRLADLALDTFVYSAGSTAVVALWAGVPLLTHAGPTNAARMGASICAAAGILEMICDSHAEYEERAVALATQPEVLWGVRHALAAGQATAPLFDTAGFARSLETAYRMMWQDYWDGVAPHPLHVP